MRLSNLLNSIVDWLSRHRLVNIVLVSGYFFFIINMHNPMVHVSIWVESIFGLPMYNKIVIGVYLLFLICVAAIARNQFTLHKDNIPLKVFYLLVTLSLVIIHSRFMFDSNIEIIHSFEFTFLAFLLFPLTKRFGAAILMAIPFMLVDEWYQYVLLYPDSTDYLDLNDVAMDTYGCAITMIVIFICGVRGSNVVKCFYRRIEFLVLVAALILITVAIKLCYIAPYASDQCFNTLLVMNQRMQPEPFWRAHPTHNITYHAMSPTEGIIVVSLLVLFYFGLDSFRKSQTTEVTA